MSNGALTGLTGEETYPVYQTRTFSPNMAEGQLQNVYGTSMPSFQFVNTTQTGTRRYNPTDPKDQEFIQRYDAAKAELEERQGADPGLPSISEIITTGIIPPIATQLVEQTVMGMLDPQLRQQGIGIGERALEGAKATFGETPQQALDASISAGYKLAPDLRTGEFYVPELASEELAGRLGQAADYERLVNLGAINEKTGAVTPGTYIREDGPYTGLNVIDPSQYSSAITQAPTLRERTGRTLNKLKDPNRLMATAAGAGVDIISELAQGRSLKRAVKNAGSRAVVRHAINTFLPAELQFLGSFAAKLFV